MKDMLPLSGACKKYEEDLVLYYYGEISTAESRAVERHLSECPACQSFVDDLRGLLPQLGKSQELPQAFWDSYYHETVARLRQREAQKDSWYNLFLPQKAWLVPALGTAAVALLAVGLLFAKGSLPLFGDKSSVKLPQAIIADTNQLEFFRSLDMLEALSQLDEHHGDGMKHPSDQSSFTTIEHAAT